jgi:hypothetical protein
VQTPAPAHAAADLTSTPRARASPGSTPAASAGRRGAERNRACGAESVPSARPHVKPPAAAFQGAESKEPPTPAVHPHDPGRPGPLATAERMAGLAQTRPSDHRPETGQELPAQGPRPTPPKASATERLLTRRRQPHGATPDIERATRAQASPGSHGVARQAKSRGNPGAESAHPGSSPLTGPRKSRPRRRIEPDERRAKNDIDNRQPIREYPAPLTATAHGRPSFGSGSEAN